MIDILYNNSGNILVGLLVILSVAGVIIKIIKDKKKGKGCGCSCAGCPNSKGCKKN